MMVMKKNEQIYSRHFYELLDHLADQFLHNEFALCTGKMLGKDICLSFKNCFSIAIIPEKLPSDFLTIAVLAKNTSQAKSKEYVYTIFIDLSEIDGVLNNSFLSIILAHHMCHFASFYELFLELEDKTEFVAYINSTQQAIPNTRIDMHNIADILKAMGDYPKEHFTIGSDTKIDYKSFFKDFSDHLYHVLNT